MLKILRIVLDGMKCLVLEVPPIRLYNYCMVIKIGDIVKWSGEEYLVVGNIGPLLEERVQLREVTDAGYDVSVDEIEEVLEVHSYGEGHVHNNNDSA